MSTIEKSIDVEVPVHTAYNQWTQFEEFPQFMEGVEAVRQLDNQRLHWRANVGGKVEEWGAVITEQHPDERIAWKNTTDASNAGVVTFHLLSDTTTRVMLQLEYDPQGVVENVGDMLGVVSRRIAGDLERFKEFIEARGQETGAWRGRAAWPVSDDCGAHRVCISPLPAGRRWGADLYACSPYSRNLKEIVYCSYAPLVVASPVS